MRKQAGLLSEINARRVKSIYFCNSVLVQVNVTESEGRMEESPRMKMSENNTLINVAVNMSRVPGLWVTEPTLARIGKVSFQ